MAQQTNTPDSLHTHDFEPAKLPKSLNVLTILTFIGCGVLLLITLFTPMIYEWSLGFMNKALASGNVSEKELAEITKGKAAMELMQANLVPMMIIGLISLVMCFLGALWMRKLKKDGFWIYSAGEILPLIGNFILIGMAQFNGVMSIVLGVGIPLLFIFLYSRQRKYLIK